MPRSMSWNSNAPPDTPLGITVEFVLELLAAGQSESEILANYPGLTRDDILACLAYASYLAPEYKAYPIPA